MLEESVESSDILLYILSALVVAFVYLKLRPSESPASSMSAATPAPVADPNKPFTLAELKQFDGSDPSKPLYLGCMGKVFDVSNARAFYGPDGAYGVFAGRDASRGLAKMEVSYTNASIADLTPSEKQTLREWSDKYELKYTIVGKIVDSSEPNSGESPKTE